MKKHFKVGLPATRNLNISELQNQNSPLITPFRLKRRNDCYYILLLFQLSWLINLLKCIKYLPQNQTIIYKSSMNLRPLRDTQFD